MISEISLGTAKVSHDLSSKYDPIFIYFELGDNVYAAQYKGQTILLDVLQNEYFSLDVDVMEYFQIILSKQFINKNNCYFLIDTNTTQSKEVEDEYKIGEYNPGIDPFIKNLLEKNLIQPTTCNKRKNKIAIALDPIGLTQMEWMPKANNVVNHTFCRTIEAYLSLIKAHHALKRFHLKGVLALMDRVNKKYAKKKNNHPEAHELEKLAQTLDRACIYFPAKTLCLAWACALTLLMIKRGWKCSFKIGIQTQPFYAHAWVESQGMIINDASSLQQRLAPILEVDF